MTTLVFLTLSALNLVPATNNVPKTPTSRWPVFVEAGADIVTVAEQTKSTNLGYGLYARYRLVARDRPFLVPQRILQGDLANHLDALYFRGLTGSRLVPTDYDPEISKPTARGLLDLGRVGGRLPDRTKYFVIRDPDPDEDRYLFLTHDGAIYLAPEDEAEDLADRPIP